MVTQEQRKRQRAPTGAIGRPRHSRARHRTRASLSVRPANEPGNGKHAPSIQRILVPLDGSPLADSVLPFVETLARRLKASVVLFQAITPGAVTSSVPEVSPYVADVVTFLQADAEKYLTRIAEELATGGLEITTMVTVESPESGIVNAANDLKADLVALATHGRSGVARWVMGSTADAVVRHAGLPCLVIRAGDGVS